MQFNDTSKDEIMYSQSSLDIYVWNLTPNSEMGNCIGYVLSLPRQPSTNFWKFLMTEWFWGLDFWIIVTFTIFFFLLSNTYEKGRNVSKYILLNNKIQSYNQIYYGYKMICLRMFSFKYDKACWPIKPKY